MARWGFTYSEWQESLNRLSAKIAEILAKNQEYQTRGQDAPKSAGVKVSQLQSILFALENYDYGYYSATDSLTNLTVDQAAELIQLSNRLTSPTDFQYAITFTPSYSYPTQVNTFVSGLSLIVSATPPNSLTIVSGGGDVRWGFTYPDLDEAKRKLVLSIAYYAARNVDRQQRGEPPLPDSQQKISQYNSILFALQYFDYGLYSGVDSLNNLSIDQAAELIQLTNRIAVYCGEEYNASIPIDTPTWSRTPTDYLTCATLGDCPLIQYILSEIGGLHPPVSVTTFGSTPNSAGLTINATTQVLNMQPANATNPGGVSTTTQSFAGLKTFTSGATISSGQPFTLSGFTQGSVVFAGASGVLTENNSQFFWQNSGRRLLIGTNALLTSQRTGSIHATSGDGFSSSALTLTNTNTGISIFSGNSAGSNPSAILVTHHLVFGSKTFAGIGVDASYTEWAKFAPTTGNFLIGTAADSGYKLNVNGTGRFSGALSCANVGFNGSAPVAKGTITGSKSGNAALDSLLTYLASRGDITDSTT